MELKDTGRLGVDDIRICDWKTTLEVQFLGRWCDFLFTTKAAEEPAVRQSRMLKALLVASVCVHTECCSWPATVASK